MSHWGQRITPEVHVTWCGVVVRAWCLPLTGVALCLCLSESLQIQADCCGSNSWCFKWSFADSSWLLQINLPECQRIKLPALPSLLKFQTFLVSMGVRWVFFHWSGFSVTVPVGSCLQGWFQLTGLPWIPPCLGLKCWSPLLTFKAPVPKLIYWQYNYYCYQHHRDHYVLTWRADQNWPQIVFLALPSAPINSAAWSNFSLASIHCARKKICCA